MTSIGGVEMVDWNLAVATATRLVRPGPEVSRDEARDVVADLWARQFELLYRLNPRWARWWREERRLLQRQSADKLPPMPDDSG